MENTKQVTLDSRIAEEISFEGIRIKSVGCQKHRSRIEVTNTDPRKVLQVHIGSWQGVTERGNRLTVSPGRTVSFTAIHDGSWQIFWEHLG